MGLSKRVFSIVMLLTFVLILLSSLTFVSACACYYDGDCDDGDDCTIDKCINFGTDNAYCSNDKVNNYGFCECQSEGFDFFIEKFECEKTTPESNDPDYEINPTWTNCTSVDWTSDPAVAGVLSKEDAQPLVVHTGGTSGIFDKSGKWDISHITFCGNDSTPPKCERVCGEKLDICTWSEPLPFGSPNCCGCDDLCYNTYWELDTTKIATCKFDGDLLSQAMLYVSINNDIVSCTLNGNTVLENEIHEGCAPADPQNGFSANLEDYIEDGENTLVCEVEDRGSMTHFDACVVGDYVECKTDEECGECEKCVDNECVFSDDEGPVTTELFAQKIIGQCKINISATLTDDCSTIEKAEYYINSPCGISGTGMSAEEGLFDEKIERAIALSIMMYDGSHNIYVRGKDAQGNWGNCEVVHIDLDCLPPNCPECEEGALDYGTKINDVCNAQELLICGNNPLVEAVICDSESKIQAAEYFLDNEPRINWQGHAMESDDGVWEDEYCEEVQAYVDISGLEDGTHYLQLHGKDTSENWGKFLCAPNVSFIKDTTAPATDKTLYPADKISYSCSGEEYNLPTGIQLTEGCDYVKSGTTIELSAQDPDPQGTGEFAGGETIYYKIWWSQDCKTNWQEGTKIEYTNTPIELTSDSCHLIEYWSTDLCGNEEEHHYELDIVDDLAPEMWKEVGEPKVLVNSECNPLEEVCDYYITQQTPITFQCTDVLPHPIGDVTMHIDVYWKETIAEAWPENPEHSFVENTNEWTFNCHKDSMHKFVYWCEDKLGNIGEKIVEIDYTDTHAPIIEKEIIGPSYGNCPPGANQINFLYNDEFEGVDGDTSSWDTSGTGYKTLTHSWSLLNGNAEVIAYKNGDDAKLTHRWNRGLGVLGGENDEVDDLNKVEKIEIEFDYAHYIDYVELRSLFADESQCQGRDEEGYIEYYLDDVLVLTENAIAVETGGDGVWSKSYSDAIFADKIIFYAENDRCSEFAVTKIGLEECYIDGATQISVNAYDPEPHPVNDVVCEWGYYWNNDYYGPYTETEFPFIIENWDESEHILEVTCKDTLGNEITDIETFLVDKTPPTTIKEYGTPFFEENNVEWITSQTSISFTVEDTGPHKSGIEGTYWRNTLVHDDYCWGKLDCQNAIGEGNWETYITPVSGISESCHLIEYYSVDNVNKTEVIKKQCVFVDNTSPKTFKEIDEPKYVCDEREEKCGPSGEWSPWYVSTATPITISCVDEGNHPVEHEKLCFKISLDDYDEQTPPYLTRNYCSKFEGNYNETSELCCIDVDNENKFTFHFLEESLHNIEWYCEDILGNHEAEINIEYDNVDDTPPEIIVHNPLPWETNVEKCAQSIVATAYDKKSGVKEVWAELWNSSQEKVREVELEHTIYNTWEAIMNKELPAGDYILKVCAKDNLGNTYCKEITETLVETVFVEYISPASCTVDSEVGGECNFKFHVCMRGDNGIQFWMNKLGDIVTPAMMNATISNGDETFVGLKHEAPYKSQIACEEMGEEYVWEEDTCWWHTEAGILQLEEDCIEINGRTYFNLHLDLDSTIITQIGPGIHDLEYWIESSLQCSA